MGRGRQGGRPRANEEDRGTSQVRLFEDVAEKVSWIVRIVGGTAAQLIDPMIRPDVEALYARHEAAILRIKAAEDALRKTEEEARATLKPKKPKG